YEFRTLWDVIGKAQGSELPAEWVVAGNHRDAWVYGAVDPNSGTAAMLEAVHGIGELLKSGWKPKRTMVFGSWDGEEEGLMGSTEWVEQNQAELRRSPAYFNMDVAVSGQKFGASAVPSLKQFVRDVTKAVPSPKGGTVFHNFAWFKKFGDPDFAYEQQMARVFGLQMVRMANADVIPYDYEEYGQEIKSYLDAAGKRAHDKFGEKGLDFAPVSAAARHFE